MRRSGGETRNRLHIYRRPCCTVDPEIVARTQIRTARRGSIAFPWSLGLIRATKGYRESSSRRASQRQGGEATEFVAGVLDHIGQYLPQNVQAVGGDQVGRDDAGIKSPVAMSRRAKWRRCNWLPWRPGSRRKLHAPGNELVARKRPVGDALAAGSTAWTWSEERTQVRFVLLQSRPQHLRRRSCCA